MSTYLQLAKKTTQLCRKDKSQPTTVVGQTNILGRIVEWVSQAYIEIQLRHNSNWRWMRRTATVTTAADDGDYAPGEWTDTTDSALISRFSSWRLNDDEDPPKCYLQSTGVGGEYWLTYTEWEWWKGIYRISQQTSTTPAHISEDPNDTVVLGPAPGDAYVVTADYVMSPQVLAADDDVPDMPTQFHDLIVFEAMKMYGETEGAAHIWISGNRRANKMMRALEKNQLSRIRLAEPMA